jgi:transposase
MVRRYELTDEEWEQIESLLPVKVPGRPGRPAKPMREMLNGIIWITRSGAPWRDLPEHFGPWETVYTRFRQLVDNGSLALIFQQLNMDADMQDLAIDSTSVKVHQHAAGAKKGANLPK